MSLIDDKNAIFGQISALRTSCEGFPKLNLSNSMCSMDNLPNPLDYLIDLLKATIGFESLNLILTKTLTYDLSKIEIEIKKALKRELKSLVSCGVNPSIPNFFLHQTINPLSTGINLDMRKVDYLGVMLIDPNTDAGLLSYGDTNGGLNSVDFHTYLFETIQQDGNQTNWGNINNGSDILSFEFNSIGSTNNQLNIKASQYYSDPVNNKKLTDLNNDFIDSVNLFGSSLMINNIVDSLFGTISSEIGKTIEQIKKEVEIEQIIECFLNTDETTIVDDSFFEFSNESVRIQEEEANSRGNGIKKIKNCGEVAGEIPIPTLTGLTTNILAATNISDVAEIITSGIDEIATLSSDKIQNKDKITAKLNFIDEAIRKLMIKMGGIILSPKIITIFAINHHIVYGTDILDPIEWMKKNKTLMTSIMTSIRETIIKILLEEVIKNIKGVVTCAAQKVIIERTKTQAAQLASLVGISQDVLRMIQGLG